jgi:hypothetical protein
LTVGTRVHKTKEEEEEDLLGIHLDEHK